MNEMPNASIEAAGGEAAMVLDEKPTARSPIAQSLSGAASNETPMPLRRGWLNGKPAVHDKPYLRVVNEERWRFTDGLQNAP
jgi:hypothetical protein